MMRIHNALIPKETRFWLYKISHLQKFQEFSTVVFKSPKGDFSLRPFDEHNWLFIRQDIEILTMSLKG